LVQYGERERLSTGESHAASPKLNLWLRLRSLTLPVLHHYLVS